MDARFCAQLNELLVTTYRAIRTIEETMLSDLSHENLSISEMHIIEAIGSLSGDRGRERGRTITEIAQMQSISLPSVTVAVKKLERKGYVYKSRCPEDGRRIYVHLTELGLRADISHRYFHRQMVHAVARAMPEADKDALIEGLSVLNNFFQSKAGELTARAQDAGAGEPSEKRPAASAGQGGVDI